MTAQLTLWGVNEILKSFFGSTTDEPADFYFALIKDVEPNAFVAGWELDEPDVTTSYKRIAIPNTALNWLSDDYDSIGNAVELEFEPALEEWGSINYWALCNSETEGYVYAVGDLADPVFIEALDVFVIPAGALVITLGPIYTEES